MRKTSWIVEPDLWDADRLLCDGILVGGIFSWMNGQQRGVS